ncbi:MAG: CRISPR-associated helicase Cas3' [Pyrinomonadaceae bacterium]
MRNNVSPPKNLWAKSVKYDANGNLEPSCLLVQHTLDVVAATKTIFAVIEKDLQRFFKLSDEQMPILKATAILAAFFHDIGKANDGFIRMLKNNGRQEIRHEHLSALIMNLPQVRSWLESPKIEYEIARVVVAGYHLKTANRASNDPRFTGFTQQLAKQTDLVVVYSDCYQFEQWLEKVRQEFGLDEVDFKIPTDWSFAHDTSNENINSHYQKIAREFGELRKKVSEQIEDDDDSMMRLWMAVKALLIAADAAASGLRRRGLPLETWIEKNLNDGETAKDLSDLIKNRIRETEERKRVKDPTFKFRFHRFQKKAIGLGDRALLLSSCGSGKTLAAYLWIRKQLKSRPNWKVAFLYPTTGTAAQGFKDYASHNKNATLISSRAEFDLDGMFENPDERGQNDYSTDKALYALGYWVKSSYVATVDTFLGFLQNGYSSLCLLPVLARSIVVIDEVHSFDSAMFAELIEFLETFDIPVLMMSASLQKERQSRLRQVCPQLDVYPQDNDLIDLPDLQKANSLERYDIKWNNTDRWWVSTTDVYPSQILELAKTKYAEGKKVLWVVNTVDRCIAIAQKLETQGAYCYHSRFKYIDRVEIHNAVVEAFRPDIEGGVIAVTTQVCEMSLDLDADVLITELAPASALIQRMGRCNRDPKGREGAGEVYIYRPPKNSHHPYKPIFYASGEELLSKIPNLKGVKQENLSYALEKVTSVLEPNKACKFTMPIWESISENDFRDIDEVTVSAVLESDLPTFRERKEARKTVADIILQAPVGYDAEKEEGIWARVVRDETKADRYEYCKKYGLRLRNK